MLFCEVSMAQKPRWSRPLRSFSGSLGSCRAGYPRRKGDGGGALWSAEPWLECVQREGGCPAWGNASYGDQRRKRSADPLAISEALVLRARMRFHVQRKERAFNQVLFLPRTWTLDWLFCFWKTSKFWNKRGLVCDFNRLAKNVVKYELISVVRTKDSFVFLRLNF